MSNVTPTAPVAVAQSCRDALPGSAENDFRISCDIFCVSRIPVPGEPPRRGPSALPLLVTPATGPVASPRVPPLRPGARGARPTVPATGPSADGEAPSPICDRITRVARRAARAFSSSSTRSRTETDWLSCAVSRSDSCALCGVLFLTVDERASRKQS